MHQAISQKKQGGFIVGDTAIIVIFYLAWFVYGGMVIFTH